MTGHDIPMTIRFSDTIITMMPLVLSRCPTYLQYGIIFLFEGESLLRITFPMHE